MRKIIYQNLLLFLVLLQSFWVCILCTYTRKEALESNTWPVVRQARIVCSHCPLSRGNYQTHIRRAHVSKVLWETVPRGRSRLQTQQIQVHLFHVQLCIQIVSSHWTDSQWDVLLYTRQDKCISLCSSDHFQFQFSQFFQRQNQNWCK